MGSFIVLMPWVPSYNENRHENERKNIISEVLYVSELYMYKPWKITTMLFKQQSWTAWTVLLTQKLSELFQHMCVCVFPLTGLHSDRISHWLQIFSWHADLVMGLSDNPHFSGSTTAESSVSLVWWTWVTWRQMTWRCWEPGPHLLLHSDHSPTSQLAAQSQRRQSQVERKKHNWRTRTENRLIGH